MIIGESSLYSFDPDEYLCFNSTVGGESILYGLMYSRDFGISTLRGGLSLLNFDL